MHDSHVAAIANCRIVDKFAETFQCKLIKKKRKVLGIEISIKKRCAQQNYFVIIGVLHSPFRSCPDDPSKCLKRIFGNQLRSGTLEYLSAIGQYTCTNLTATLQAANYQCTQILFHAFQKCLCTCLMKNLPL